jgi:hypothetical protein
MVLELKCKYLESISIKTAFQILHNMQCILCAMHISGVLLQNIVPVKCYLYYRKIHNLKFLPNRLKFKLGIKTQNRNRVEKEKTKQKKGEMSLPGRSPLSRPN